MNCLVTGATGFIGGHLVRELVRRGHSVRILVRTEDGVEKLRNLRIEVYYGDITDKDRVREALKDVEVVFHCAGLLGHQFGVPKSQYYNVNVVGTKNLIEISCQEKIRKFIFCSSASVIGPTEGFIGDERRPYNFTNAYEWSKMKAEEVVQKSGLNYVILRPRFVYGEEGLHVLKLFKAVQKRRLFLIGKGNAKLHPTYIEDLVEAFLLCLDDKVNNETYIIAGPDSLTIKEFASTVANELGVTLPKACIPIWLAYALAGIFEFLGIIVNFKPILTIQGVKLFTKSRVFSTRKAEAELSYIPKIKVREGIQKTINWYREQGFLE